MNKIKLTKILHNKSYLLFNLHIRTELLKVNKQELGIELGNHAPYFSNDVSSFN